MFIWKDLDCSVCFTFHMLHQKYDLRFTVRYAWSRTSFLNLITNSIHFIALPLKFGTSILGRLCCTNHITGISELAVAGDSCVFERSCALSTSIQESTSLRPILMSLYSMLNGEPNPKSSPFLVFLSYLGIPLEIFDNLYSSFLLLFLL